MPNLLVEHQDVGMRLALLTVYSREVVDVPVARLSVPTTVAFSVPDDRRRGAG